LTHDLVERCMNPVKQAIADAKLSEKDLERRKSESINRA